MPWPLPQLSHDRALNRQLAGNAVHLRFGEHRGDALLKELVRDAFDIVDVDDAQRRRERQTVRDDGAQLAQKLRCLHVKAGFLLHIDARDH